MLYRFSDTLELTGPLPALVTSAPKHSFTPPCAASAGTLEVVVNTSLPLT